MSCLQDEWLSVGETRKLLGLSSRSLRGYTRLGRLEDVRGPSGRRIFRRSGVERLVQRRTVALAGVVLCVRVSSRRQQRGGDLDRQEERLRALAEVEGREVLACCRDVASGVSDRRRGLGQALDGIAKREVTELWVTSEDRLARFGVQLVDRYARQAGVRVRGCFPDGEGDQVDPRRELVRDMLSVVTSFSGRLYGQRPRVPVRCVTRSGRLRERDRRDV